MSDKVAIDLKSDQFGRDDFWRESPPLPAGLRLEHLGSIIVPRRGPGGAWVQDEATLESPNGRTRLLIEYRARVLPRDVPGLGERLRSILQQKRLREQALGSASEPSLPVIATEVATPAVQDACLAAELGLVDRTGTLLLRGPSLFIHVRGTARVLRTSRANPFRGRGTRHVRLLLSRPEDVWTAQALADESETSYVFSHGVLWALEREGFVFRRSPRGGFRLRDGAGLLRRWSEGDDNSAVVIERFNAPSTEPAVLREARDALASRSIRSIFTLGSALRPQEVFSSALPHGLYVSGDLTPAITVLGLRRITPHNLYILKPHPAVDTDAGGVYCAPRPLDHGQGVALPQLVLDFLRVGGRGPEQSKALLEQFARELPYAEAEA